MPNLFDEAIAAEGVTGPLAQLARGIYAQESGGGKNTKTSNREAVGGMQIQPGAFGEVADKGWSINDPMHNLRAGIRYLKARFDQAGGNPELAAAGYYGGPKGLEKARLGIPVSDPVNPKAPNTLQYGAQVVAKAGLTPGGGSAAPASVPAAVAASPVQVAALAPASAAGAPLATSAAIPAAEPLPGALAAAADQSAWVNFLRAMPQGRRPVAATDLSYGAPALAIAAPQMGMPAPMQQRVPNFEAFSSFGKRRS